MVLRRTPYSLGEKLNGVVIEYANLRPTETQPPRDCERCGRPMSRFHHQYERICRPCHYTIKGWS